MENTLTLYNLSAEMAEIENALMENGGELTPELEAKLATTSDALIKKADDYGAVIEKFTAAVAACKAEIDRIKVIQKVADNSLKSIKEHLASTMDAFGMKSLEGKLHKFSLTKTTATEVDEDTLLAPYKGLVEALQAKLPSWVTVDCKVSKSDLKAAYKDKDVTLDGLTFVENKSLRIK